MNKNIQGALGMNARNLLYVRPYNRGSAIRLANNKLRSKEALFKAGIPVPKVYGIIRNKEELEVFKWGSLPKSFVLKPNHGGGGEGIKVIFGQNKDASWVSTKGEKITIADLSSHIMNIFEGFYSLSRINDIAFFEERIKLSKTFKPYAFKGIPDIRVIVFNKVPVMAMLRLPTKESGGKANLHQGGIGVGIDISTGVTTHAIMYDHIIEKTPDTKLALRGIKIPYWKEILEIAIKCQEISKLGYVGVDIAMDRDRGPVVLEINAHPGLSIQNANLASLKYRLQKVTGIKVKNEAHGIRLAQDLFGGEIQQEIEEISGKQIVGIVELIKIKREGQEDTELKAKIDTGADLSSMDKNLAKELGYEDVINEFDEDVKNMQIGEKAEKVELDKKIKDKIEKWGDRFDTIITKSSHGTSYRLVIKMDVSLSGKEIVSKMTITDRSNLEFPVIIGRKDLRGFLVDPSKRQSHILDSIVGVTANTRKSDIGSIIKEIISSENEAKTNNEHAKEKIISYTRKINEIPGINDIYHFIDPNGSEGRSYASEMKIFLENVNDVKYNPRFEYGNLESLQTSELDAALNKLDNILKKVKLEDNDLVREIIAETASLARNKIIFMMSVKNDEEDKTFEYAKKIYGDINTELVKKAEEVYDMFLKRDEREEDDEVVRLRSKILNASEIKEKFQDTLKEMGLVDWNVILSDESARITVKFGSVKYEKPTVIIPIERKINGLNLLKTIIHEIVHIKTNSNNYERGLEGVVFGKNYELYQEGLARIISNNILNEISATEKELPSPYYILAMDKIKNGHSYHKCFNYIFGLKLEELKKRKKKYINIENVAAKETMIVLRRVYRGFRASLSSGKAYFPKDKMYLEGDSLSKKMCDANLENYLIAAKTDPYLLPTFIRLGIISRETIKYNLDADIFIFKKMIKDLLKKN
jgi:alpha-L-glutamate ligase-like protein